MVNVLHFYMDDSGTRHPDHKPGKRPAHNHDWFSLGGVLVKQEDEHLVRALHKEFCTKWGIGNPLRSADIRSRSDEFHWLESLSAESLADFYEGLYQMMAKAPLIGHACVIDRPGYNARYRAQYGDQRWRLCKTAFALAVERAAKQADQMGYKLKVFPERGDKDADNAIRSYYAELKTNGMPFAQDTSGKYQPLMPADFTRILYDLDFKYKSSPMAQFADLYLWPMCMGGYDQNNRPYVRLKGDSRLIDCHLRAEDIPHLGIKYSCWELEIEAKKPKAQGSPGL